MPDDNEREEFEWRFRESLKEHREKLDALSAEKREEVEGRLRALLIEYEKKDMALFRAKNEPDFDRRLQASVAAHEADAKHCVDSAQDKKVLLAECLAEYMKDVGWRMKGVAPEIRRVAEEKISDRYKNFLEEGAAISERETVLSEETQEKLRTMAGLADLDRDLHVMDAWKAHDEMEKSPEKAWAHFQERQKGADHDQERER